MPRSAWLLLPVITVAGIVAFVLIGRPLDDFAASAPPTEEIVVEQVRLEPGVIRLTVRVDGSDPVRIAQVQVDGAYRQFEQNPAGPLSRLASAVISIPYHWIEGETHHLLLLTSSGAAFEHTIEVAQATPTGSSFGLLLLVGILLGIAPVAAGLLAYPAIRDMRPAGLRFLLALTLGLLGFLFIDTIGEGLEIGGEVLGRLNGDVLVWVAAGVTLMTLLLAGRRSGKPPEGIRLAFFIALGIGLHNLGEGLVVGASLATGAAALATFLMVGFVLHNVTEGIGIATPMTKARPGWQVFVALAALAGLPAVVGVWGGSQAVSPQFVALSFGIGAGAILQVIVELGGFMVRQSGAAALTSLSGAGGIAAGLLIMYSTAILV